MRVKYTATYLENCIATLNYIPCYNLYYMQFSYSQYLRDFRSSSGSFGSPVLVTSVELVQAETEFSSLKSDVMMTANRCSDLTY